MALLWAPLPLRLILGISFIYHGRPKFTPQGHRQITGTVKGLGLFWPGLWGWAVALVEVLGGAALLVGLVTRFAAAALVVDMLVALFGVHRHAGYSFLHIEGMTPEGPRFGMPGWEINLLYIAGLAALVIGGAGVLSIDSVL